MLLTIDIQTDRMANTILSQFNNLNQQQIDDLVYMIHSSEYAYYTLQEKDRITRTHFDYLVSIIKEDRFIILTLYSFAHILTDEQINTLVMCYSSGDYIDDILEHCGEVLSEHSLAHLSQLINHQSAAYYAMRGSERIIKYLIPIIVERHWVDYILNVRAYPTLTSDQIDTLVCAVQDKKTADVILRSKYIASQLTPTQNNKLKTIRGV